jgi:hypothetical protein
MTNRPIVFRRRIALPLYLPSNWFNLYRRWSGRFESTADAKG